MKVLTDNKYYSQIANVIREQNGTNNTYTPPQMVSALKDLFYEEVEGVPPITFQGIGENLLDYRIDGASGGVGERTKNLLNNILNTQIKNGVTFTVNENKSVTCNGKNQNENQGLFVTIGDYSATNDVILSGGVSGGNLSSYILRAYTLTDNPVIYYDEGDGVTLPAGNDYRIQIRIAGDYTCNNLTFYPMIRFATVADNSYEPYGYKVPVVVNGKNLLDEANAVVTDYYLTNDGQEAVGANGDRFLKSYINVNPSTEYTFKWSQTIMGYSNNTPYIRITEYTSNKTFIKRVLCQCSAQSQNNYTFTTSNNTVYIDIRIDSETSTRGQHITEVMLVKGATAPDTYEEYTATTTNIYLNEPIDGRANIPSEYEEVEYIESTGTQYINTGINTNTTTSRYETKINPSSVSGTMGIFGTRNDYTSANQSSMNAFIIDGTFRLDWLSGTFSSSARISTNTEYEISITRGLATINNVNYTSGNTTSIDSLYPFYVGTFNNAGSVYSNGFSGKIYYSKLYNNNILVFDGVPCYRKSDNEIGMYDLVSNTFFTNAGTGNFIVGLTKENESISLSDTNVNIPTIRGTNVLTVDTTVQPSNVYVKSRHESSYETAMRERYEEAQAQLDALESGGE